MTSAQALTGSLLSLQTDETYSEAVVTFEDGSRLCFCHRVGERWAKAVGPDAAEQESGVAGRLLAAVSMFRLNAKHLEIQFQDGSRWEEPFRPTAS